MALAAEAAFVRPPAAVEAWQAPVGRVDIAEVERREEDRLICAFLEWLLPKSSGDRLASSHHREESRRCRFDDFWALFKADGSLDWPEFEQFVRWESRFAGSARRLFDLLDEGGCGRISARTVLQARREFERSTDVRHSNLDDLKKVLLHQHGNLGRAWRKEFDPEQTGKCCQRSFVKACRAVGFQGDLKGTWAELTDGDIHRQATLRDLDPQVDELIVSFVQALKRWHNSAREGWFAVMKAHGSHGRMQFSEFVSIGARLGFGERDLKKIFNCLDANLDRRVSLSEWMFLELWETRLASGGSSSSRMPSAGSTSAPSTARRPQAAQASGAAALALAAPGPPSSDSFGGQARRSMALSARGGGGGTVASAAAAASAAVAASAASPGLVGSGEGVAEFVVVLTKEEYEEYQRRLRQRYGSKLSSRPSGGAGAGRFESLAGAAGPSATTPRRSRSTQSPLISDAARAAAPSSPSFGVEVA